VVSTEESKTWEEGGREGGEGRQEEREGDQDDGVTHVERGHAHDDPTPLVGGEVVASDAPTLADEEEADHHPCVAIGQGEGGRGMGTGLEDEVGVDERDPEPKGAHLPELAGAPEGGPEDEDDHLGGREGEREGMRPRGSGGTGALTSGMVETALQTTTELSL
jgi:hypothetical protein